MTVAPSPRWLQSIEPDRATQIALASLILLGSILVHLRHGSASLILFLDAALYLGVILAARWGLRGALGLIPLSLCLFAAAPDAARLGEYALFLPLIGGPSRGPIRGWIVYTALALIVLTSLTVSRAGQRNLITSVVFWLLGFGAMWIIAIMFRQLAQKAALLHDMALAEQRLTIARDVHDTVAHHATEIAMRAEQALLSDGADRADLAFIAATARNAVEEIRATLATLTDTARDVPVIEQPSTLSATIERATQRLTAAGHTVNLTEATDGLILPPDMLAEIHAILREAVNNIIKHGDPTQPCGVIAEVAGETLEITLVNVRRATENQPRDVPLGVMGMQARAGQIGGALDAVASADRWLTRLTVPLSIHREEASP